MSDQFTHDDIKYGIDKWIEIQKRDQNLRAIKLILIVVLFSISFAYALFREAPSIFNRGVDYAGVVRIDGVISHGSLADANKITQALRQAFKDNNAKGLAIIINSPGGSPAQSMIIYETIKRLKAKYNKQVIIVAEDSLTSGAYLISMAADRIYAMPSTTVGSIGVVLETMAFNNLAQKWGVEKRIYTAGESKKRFDPFSEEKQSDIDKANEVLSTIHTQFIKIVESSRGNRLAGDRNEIFNGDFWTGEKALELGLIDKIGTVYQAVESEFGVEELRQYRVRSTFADVLQSLPF